VLRTPSAQTHDDLGVSKQFAEARRGPDDDSRWLGRASEADHVRLRGHQYRGGAVGSDQPGDAENFAGLVADEHCPGGAAVFAVEGCTGWRFVVEELTALGAGVHLADPAVTAGLRGRKKRAKTDRADARLLRSLLWKGRLPESAIARRMCWRRARWAGCTAR
jgi:hypothetical protein